MTQILNNTGSLYTVQSHLIVGLSWKIMISLLVVLGTCTAIKCYLNSCFQKNVQYNVLVNIQLVILNL